MAPTPLSTGAGHRRALLHAAPGLRHDPLCDLHPRKVYDVVLGRSEIACMWRFTRNNGITEGFHNKMELITRQAYGFRNFENYRIRVKVLCS
jgi:hypothetical protein